MDLLLFFLGTAFIFFLLGAVLDHFFFTQDKKRDEENQRNAQSR